MPAHRATRTLASLQEEFPHIGLSEWKTHSGGGWTARCRVDDTSSVSGNAVAIDSTLINGAAVHCDATVIDSIMDGGIVGDQAYLRNCCTEENSCVCGKANVTNVNIQQNQKIYGGTWTLRGPSHIVGSRHVLSQLDRKRIRIGCQERTIQDWLNNFRKIGRDWGYTAEQIAEYGHYIRAIAARMGVKSSVKKPVVKKKARRKALA